MPIPKEELQERAQLVRIHEANCHIEHPTPDEANFRIAVMKKLGVALQLGALRKVEIVGPVTAGARPVPRSQQPTPAKGAK